MRDCGGEDKRNDMEDIFERCNLDNLTVTETKLKERGEVIFGKVKERTSKVKVPEGDKKGVRILMKDEMWKYVMKYK